MNKLICSFRVEMFTKSRPRVDLFFLFLPGVGEEGRLWSTLKSGDNKA